MISSRTIAVPDICAENQLISDIFHPH